MINGMYTLNHTINVLVRILFKLGSCDANECHQRMFARTLAEQAYVRA